MKETQSRLSNNNQTVLSEPVQMLLAALFSFSSPPLWSFTPHNAPQRSLFCPCAISENIGARDSRELFRDIGHQNSITWRSHDHRGEAGNFQNRLRPNRKNALPCVKSWQEQSWNGVIITADLRWCGIHKQDPLCFLNTKLLFGKVSFIVVLFYDLLFPASGGHIQSFADENFMQCLFETSRLSSLNIECGGRPSEVWTEL